MIRKFLPFAGVFIFTVISIFFAWTSICILSDGSAFSAVENRVMAGFAACTIFLMFTGGSVCLAVFSIKERNSQ